MVASQRKYELKVTVNMRVTYVTVDRSGWFDPSIAQMSGAFMHLYQGDDYASWSTWGEKRSCRRIAKTPRRPKKQRADALKGTQMAAEISQGNTANITEGYLSAFPVGYVLVKDCVIQVQSDSFKSDEDRSSFKENSATSVASCASLRAALRARRATRATRARRRRVTAWSSAFPVHRSWATRCSSYIRTSLARLCQDGQGLSL